MTEQMTRSKGRRIGGTVSTLTDPTAPEAFTPAPASATGERPLAEDLVAPRSGDMPREQINGSTPVVLQLRRRMGQYRLDTGMDVRDQVALAIDQWLRSHGY